MAFRSSPAAPPIKAALAYFAIVFAAGFVLGTIRTLLLVPRVGPFTAVLIEIPVMLALAWIACRWAVSRYEVESSWVARLVMGALALALLLLAELILSVAAFGITVAGFLSAYATPAGAAGLAAQVGFAAMPLIVGRASVGHR
jgi:hypothetical protein